MANSWLIAGKATLAAESIKGVRKEANVAAIRAARLLEAWPVDARSDGISGILS